MNPSNFFINSISWNMNLNNIGGHFGKNSYFIAHNSSLVVSLVLTFGFPFGKKVLCFLAPLGLRGNKK